MLKHRIVCSARLASLWLTRTNFAIPREQDLAPALDERANIDDINSKHYVSKVKQEQNDDDDGDDDRRDTK